ncbi:MAG: serine kinase [Candidatus Coatesbacteria bacterium]|nr:MAG: serine kinase [Candidatus Coatesbacteria bacterium]
MELKKIVDKLGLEVAAGAEHLGRAAQSSYVSDLLSDVMANAGEGTLWITIQTHANIVAVCALHDLAAVVIANGKRPNEETLARAEEEGVVLLLSPQSAFDVAGRLYELGLRGIER